MSLPQSDDTVPQVVKKRRKQPDLLCWTCQKQDDTLYPKPCKGRERYQSGYCVDKVEKTSFGVKGT